MPNIPFPPWARWFTEIGKIAASLPTASVGEPSARIVVSVPTGQYAAWLIASGAFRVTPTLVSDIQDGTICATWVSSLNKMDDTRIEVVRTGEWRFGTTTVRADWPVMPIPVGTPLGRAGQGVAGDLRDELRKLPGKSLTWHKWYAQQCLAPVVVIGSGREYLQEQRNELLVKTPSWFDGESRALLLEDTAQTSNPERLLFHPFAVFAASVGDKREWLRQMKPRLVVCTAWSTFKEAHKSLFSGSPHIILTNRRVGSSLAAADETESCSQNERICALISELERPYGIHVRVYDEVVEPDSGDKDDDDEIEVEL